MIVINDLNYGEVVFSQRINPLNTYFIQAYLGNSLVIEHLESDNMITQKLGDDLLFFCNNSKEPVIVLEGYFQAKNSPELTMKTEGEMLVYQLDTLMWAKQTAKQDYPKEPLQPTTGGLGASTGIPPLVWGFGALANNEKDKSKRSIYSATQSVRNFNQSKKFAFTTR